MQIKYFADYVTDDDEEEEEDNKDNNNNYKMPYLA